MFDRLRYAFDNYMAKGTIALIGALFAGIVLMRRNRRLEGIGVIVLGVVCTALGLVLWR